jgi:hypothetical protein
MPKAIATETSNARRIGLLVAEPTNTRPMIPDAHECVGGRVARLQQDRADSLRLRDAPRADENNTASVLNMTANETASTSALSCP